MFVNFKYVVKLKQWAMMYQNVKINDLGSVTHPHSGIQSSFIVVRIRGHSDRPNDILFKPHFKIKNSQHY